MFESAALHHEIPKDEYEREVAQLRTALLHAQMALRDKAPFAVLVLIAGVEGAGKGETVNLLNEWMDPRFIEVSGFALPTDEEAARPPMWRFWRALPPKGRIGIFFGAWHTAPIVERVAGRLGAGAYQRRIDEIVQMERMLHDEGVLLLKYWFHITRKDQRKRLKVLEKDPATAWRVSKMDWKLYRHYDDFFAVTEPFLRVTSTAEAPWLIVPGAEPRYRSLLVGRHLLEALEARLASGAAPPPATPDVPMPPALDKLNILRSLRLDRKLDKPDYARRLETWQGRLATLSRDAKFAKRSVVAVFEGNDAAGKGGAVRRVTAALDARRLKVVPVAAPTEEERAQPYMWRFWRHIPPPGFLTIFDRSWYGRVLVERVEGFCAPPDWQRAYAEINEFEAQLVESRVVLAKFWLAISNAEQLRRFQEREATPFKRHKITPEDWRNREKWDAYEQAVCDMVDRTSTAQAPWTLVEANNKYYARLKVLRTLVESIERAFDA
ncbi:polyphosphate:AMP phosphotransferase [Falsiroseomonas oryzae]|uniref:polyphosphate:AMP phosphotransferase n=1 Tax=Falsiroseomonas oryzae TaxID=2766473 RepID=UPI0022EB2A27|nr:polyphosphate:AMP phosphotransferase [Roseomonas sp. MO-31]